MGVLGSEAERVRRGVLLALFCEVLQVSALGLLLAFDLAHAQIGRMTATLVVLPVAMLTELGQSRLRERLPEGGIRFDLATLWIAPAIVAAGPVGSVCTVLGAQLVRGMERDRPSCRRFLRRTSVLALPAAVAAHAFQLMSPPGEPLRVLGVVGALALFVGANYLLVFLRVTATTPARVAWAQILEVAPTDGMMSAVGLLAAVAAHEGTLLVALVLPAAWLVQQAMLHPYLTAEADRDAKTGLHNIRGLRRAARRLLMEHVGKGVAVMMIDLDDFKQVNTDLGHVRADRVLAAVAARLRSGVDRHSVVARFGGEEFAVLICDVTATDARALGERLRRVATEQPVAVSDDRDDTTAYSITASAGLAWAPPSAPCALDLDQLLSWADEALMAAKRQGKNRLIDAGGVRAPSESRC